MNRQINFGDTIFILDIQIRMIQDMLILDANPDFFLDKTLADLEFIDAALETLLREILDNARLVDRNGHLGSLHEAEGQFQGILRDLADGSGTLSAASWPALREKIGLIRERSLERRETVARHIRLDEASPQEPVVSSDELNELLRDF
jgi:hypothetical protein